MRFIIPLCLLLIGCQPDYVFTKNSCEFTGSWLACSTNGTDSQRISLQINGVGFSEEIDTFTGTTDCSGTASGNFSFAGTLYLGTQHRSSHILGGTDATITPDVDVFGCGANLPAYTALKFTDDCKSFNPAQGIPVCDPNSVNSSTDPTLFFERQ